MVDIDGSPLKQGGIIDYNFDLFSPYCVNSGASLDVLEASPPANGVIGLGYKFECRPNSLAVKQLKYRCDDTIDLLHNRHRQKIAKV